MNINDNITVLKDKITNLCIAFNNLSNETNKQKRVSKDTKVYKGLAGPVRLLESKWGFLLLIVLPTMIAVIYEFYAIIVEIIEFKKEVDNE